MAMLDRAFENRKRRRSARGRSAWPGAAFIMEALILLLFLAACLAVFMELFGAANQRGVQNMRYEQAVILASNEAERFAADPAAAAAAVAEGAGDTATSDGLEVSVAVVPEPTAAGVLYRADIVVTDGDGELYRLQTACYAGTGDESGVE